MKVGLEPLLDIERVKAIRKAIGPDMLIDIDVNGAYSPKDAIYVLKRVSDCGNIIVEQPVHRDDLFGMAMVRKAVDDMVHDLYGEENPRPLEDYAPRQGPAQGDILM